MNTEKYNEGKLKLENFAILNGAFINLFYKAQNK